MLDVPKLMYDLASDRPVFHSEADFQHALAWRIHAEGLDAPIRLEWLVELPNQGKRIHLDLWLPDSNVAVELKYLTRRLEHEHDGERFVLRDQSARTHGRYGFLKDIERLEQLSLSERTAVQSGFAILLTNDPLYWKPPRREGAVDAEYTLHEGRTIEKEMAWSELAAAGTIKGREDPICLEGSYDLRWQEYSGVGDGSNRQFRYLAVRISCPSKLNGLR